jgi:hypothetical protein
MKAALVLTALLAAAPAAAENCAQYADPLAYNACLARQGPSARAVHMTAAPAAGVPRRAGGRVVASGRRGRSEMVFSIRK